MQRNSFEVCVHCLTFQHAQYIIEAMNGFTMQETDFPYICCILDDASTDGEPEIIRQYLQKNFNIGDQIVAYSEETDEYRLCYAQHKTNKNCYFAVFLLKYNHHSIKKSKVPYTAIWDKTAKYIAFCEGDDYWVHPQKLQKQYDVLESNRQCGIVFCKVQKIRKDGTIITGDTIPHKNDIKNGIVTLEDYCKEEFLNGHWCFHTSCFMFRSYLYNQSRERDLFFAHFPFGDMPTQLWCLLHSKGYYLDFIGSYYRWLSGGYFSYYYSHPDFAVKQERGLIDALKFLDEYTSFDYHRYIRARIHRVEYIILKIQGHYLPMLKPRYWKFLFRAGYRRILLLLKKLSVHKCSNAI